MMLKLISVLGVVVITSTLLAVAAVTYSETVKSHDTAILMAVRGYIGCQDGHVVIKNVTFERVRGVDFNNITCDEITH